MESIQVLLKAKVFTISTNGHLPTPSHHEGTSDPTRMKGLARQFQGIVRDVEELKKGKRSATVEQRVRDNIGGVSSPHHQRAYENAPPYRYYDMSAQSSYLFHESGYQGRQAM
ncbi:hypothetical protein M9H77_07500 [Catharanthus roseus]|uniref:Uncharacterized protein n=1 Tax=Catharanthus roseus TaxID=4058 RepID=A0ACC0BV40_CATRO|nr:hypothetical protein M9H77_07500 [Catharanthus roseus]